METHSNGPETAFDLETRFPDETPIFHHYSDDGFTAVNDELVFVVHQEATDTPEGFRFRKIPFETIHQFRIELGTPEDRYQDGEKKTPQSPVTHVRLYLPSDAVDTFVDADPREVASAFLTLNLDTTS